ncbi:MAG: hypothetical protein WBX00_12855 [Isosphaeraceae bacterium]
MSDNPPDKGSGVRPPLAENRLLTRALRLGWPVPPEMKAAATERMGEILKTSKSGKAWVSAARVLVGMERTELAAVDLALRAQQDSPDAAVGADVIRQAAEKGRERLRTRKADPASLKAAHMATLTELIRAKLDSMHEDNSKLADLLRAAAEYDRSHPEQAAAVETETAKPDPPRPEPARPEPSPEPSPADIAAPGDFVQIGDININLPD